MLDNSTIAQIDRALTTAKMLHAYGRLAEARHACDLILRIDPINQMALIRLGLIAREEQRLPEAAAHLAAALAAHPDSLYAARLLATAYRELQRLDDAERLLETWLGKTPGDPELLLEQGRCLLDRGNPAAAVAAFEGALAAAPENAQVWSLLGVARRRIKDKPGAFAAFSAALQRDPQDAIALNGIGNDHLEREDFASAARHFRAALQVKPDFGKARKNLAYTLSLNGEIEAARAEFEELLARHDHFSEAHMDFGLFLLSLGDYARGWAEYEHRWRFAGFGERDWGGGLPRWDGAPLRGRHLLLWGEQGLGDHILYGTMLPDIIRRAAGRITLAVEDRLVPLFARSFRMDGVDVVPRGAATGADLQSPFGSLGAMSRLRREDFSNGVFLRADQARVAALRHKYRALGKSGDRLIGLSWRSANWHIGSYKSLSLEALLPVLRRPGITWICLQYGNVDGEIAALAAQHGVTIHRDPDVDATSDLDGLAAQIAALDGVVSSSNSTVHFSGALGIPCHLLLGYGRGRLWYWPRGAERSPWYDSIRLIHQAAPGDWSAALQRLDAMLDRGV